MASVSDGAMERDTRFRRGLPVQFRVTGALMLRELHMRYGRENIGYLWLILEPLLLAAMIGLMHQRGPAHFGSDIKPVPLALVGYCNFMTFRGIINRAEGALEGSASLFYHRTISVFDILISRALLEVAGTFVSFVILISLAIAFGLAGLPERPLWYLLGVFLMFWQCFALSMIVCSITHENRSIGRLIHPITYIMMPLSGAFFVLSELPSEVRKVFYWVPLSHIFELLRYGWFDAANPDFIDPMYLGIWLMASTLIGLLLISVVRKRIELN
ncbi:ABC transporter permease [Sphingomonas sp. SUN019]|uniref:ABC transporter permease n=1 Tax=Sphingomonas sp. SUN019 TaxID=2937788 RepID=UPI0021647B29|nr:ABC transporter permease [Sphingomonas sp. SUN019]UVO52383.1 ABC transporter permease [Sphingomonas sp. SUN019]